MGQATACEVQGLGLRGNWAKPRDLGISSGKWGAAPGDDSTRPVRYEVGLGTRQAFLLVFLYSSTVRTCHVLHKTLLCPRELTAGDRPCACTMVTQGGTPRGPRRST